MPVLQGRPIVHIMHYNSLHATHLLLFLSREALFDSESGPWRAGPRCSNLNFSLKGLVVRHWWRCYVFHGLEYGFSSCFVVTKADVERSAFAAPCKSVSIEGLSVHL